MADRAELDRSYMSQIERGIKNATLNSIWRISQALEVKASDLLELTEKLEAEGETAAVMKSSSKGASADTKPIILVVDDEIALQSAMTSLLVSSGHEVIAAGSCEEMLARIARSPCRNSSCCERR